MCSVLGCFWAINRAILDLYTSLSSTTLTPTYRLIYSLNMIMSTEPAVQLLFSPDEINDLLSFINYNPTTTSTTTTLSSSSDTNRSVYSLEERKHRRMISNRESARRSRQRKKRHLEKLVAEMNRLKGENRELKEQLCLATYRSHVVTAETELLRSEYINLQTRLFRLYPSLMSMQL